MKTILSALALASSMFCTSVSAEPLRMFSVSNCDSKEIVYEFLSGEYEEVPFATGPGAIQRPDGAFAQGMYMIWANPQTMSFSITIEFDDDIVCIMGMGGDLAPASRGPKI